MEQIPLTDLRFIWPFASLQYTKNHVAAVTYLWKKQNIEF